MEAAHRLDRLRTFLAAAHRRYDLAFGFRLWDGSIVPEGYPPAALALAIRDAGVVAGLVRRPSLERALDAYETGGVGIVNGTILDFERARPRGGLGQALRRAPWGETARLAAAFWRAGREAPDGASPAVKSAAPMSDGSGKAEIAFHYDVSDAFYRLFLDERMVYSCGYFTEPHADIERAQRDKLDMICRKLRLKPGDRFLDIGCGWGALICHAAAEYGVVAHGVTLSENQAAEARRRAAALGLSDQVTVHLRSYADLTGRFDKIASIGMFEHVGIANHAEYFAAVRRLLAPRGLYLHHAISRWAKPSERAFHRRTAGRRWVNAAIFPGGELDHLGMTIAGLQRAGFEAHDVESWREHYARTTQLWHDRLQARRAEAEAEVGARLVRRWLLYLAVSCVLFERGGVGIFQTLASRKRGGASGLPPTRADLYTG